MYSLALTLLLKNKQVFDDGSIQAHLIDYITTQLKLAPTEQEVPFLLQLVLQRDNITLLDACYDQLNLSAEALTHTTTLTQYQAKCPVSLSDHITREDGLCYFTESGHFEYLSNLTILANLPTGICPVSKSKFAWIIKLSDLNDDKFNALLKDQTTLKTMNDFSGDQRSELVEWSSSLKKAIVFTPEYEEEYEEEDIQSSDLKSIKEWTNTYRYHQLELISKTQPLWWLCRNQEGLGILTKLPDEFFVSIPSQAWETPCEDGYFKGTTPLWWLCETAEGRGILTKLSAAFFVSIPSQAWATPCEDGPNKGTTPLYWLCGMPEGRGILTKLSAAFFVSIPSQAWATPHEYAPYKGTTPLYWLCGTAEGLGILTKLSAAFFVSIPSQAWTTPCEDGPDKGTTPLYLLCATAEGRGILTKLPDEFFVSIPSQAWATPHEYAVYKGTTPLYWLCGTIQGLEILHKLLRLDIIDPALLSLEYGSNPGNGIRSAYAMLQSTEIGIKFIKKHIPFFSQIDQTLTLMDVDDSGNSKRKGETQCTPSSDLFKRARTDRDDATDNLEIPTDLANQEI